MWDPSQYLRYAEERSRPFVELLARVHAVAPSYVVDLGCGPGTLTTMLLDRWPDAMVEGIDSSPEMVQRAREAQTRPRLSFSLGDIRDWTPERPVDVLVSNAALQWVPQHVDLLPRLLDRIAAGGWFAFQVPGNFDSPSHLLLHELRNSSSWRAKVGDERVQSWGSAEPEEYLSRLSDLGCVVDVWETTYLHILQGEDAVLQWVKGTALRPVLDVLNEVDRETFATEYGAALRAAYPRRSYGTLFPFRRIYVAARVSPDAGRRRSAPRTGR